MAEQLAKVGDVIPFDGLIPANAVRVNDKDGDDYARMPEGWWHCQPDDTDASCIEHPDAELLAYAPLTVTAVREPEPAAEDDPITPEVYGEFFPERDDAGRPRKSDGPESASGLCEVGADGVNCIVADPKHRRIYHGDRPAAAGEPDDVVHYYFTELRTGLTYCGISAHDDDVLTTSEAGKATCEGCCAAADEDEPAAGKLADPNDYPPAGTPHGFRPHWSHECTEAVVRNGEIDSCHERPDADVHTPPAAEPQQDGPRTLTLPEVPEGATIVGHLPASGDRIRLMQRIDGRWHDDEGDFVPRSLGAVLDALESVTVEMAPPREPRTWQSLNGAPDDLIRVRGASGTVYTRWTVNGVPEYRADRAIRGSSFSHLQEVDGPLTEVLDEPGGQQ